MAKQLNPFPNEEETDLTPKAIKNRQKAMKAFVDGNLWPEFLKLLEAKKAEFFQPLPSTPAEEYTYTKSHMIREVMDMVVGFIEEDAIAAVKKGESK